MDRSHSCDSSIGEELGTRHESNTRVSDKPTVAPSSFKLQVLPLHNFDAAHVLSCVNRLSLLNSKRLVLEIRAA